MRQSEAIYALRQDGVSRLQAESVVWSLLRPMCRANQELAGGFRGSMDTAKTRRRVEFIRVAAERCTSEEARNFLQRCLKEDSEKARASLKVRQVSGSTARSLTPSGPHVSLTKAAQVAGSPRK